MSRYVGTVGLDGIFDRFAAFAGPLLNSPQNLIVIAVDQLKIVVREFGPLLFEFALDDVPVALDLKFVHRNIDRSFPRRAPWGETLLHDMEVGADTRKFR